MRITQSIQNFGRTSGKDQDRARATEPLGTGSVPRPGRKKKRYVRETVVTVIRPYGCNRGSDGWIARHAEPCLDVMRTLRKINRQKMEEVPWDQEKDIRYWLWLRGALNRTALPGNQVETGSVAADPSYVLSESSRNEELPWTAEAKAVLPVKVVWM